MIPSALLLLIRLQVKGFFRRMVRRARGVRGILLSIVGGLFLVAWLGGQALSFAFANRNVHVDVSATQHTYPVVILGMSLLFIIGSTGGKGVLFTAAETDQLFPGPFSRRQLLLYRFLRRGLVSLIGALFWGFWTRSHSVSWVASYVPTVLLLWFFQALGMAANMAFLSVSERITGKTARNVLLALTGALCLAAIYLVPPPPPLDLRATTLPAIEDTPVVVMLRSLRDSPITQTLAMPFRPFAYAMTAPTWAGLAGWSVASALLLAATLAVAIWLDADYLEVSANTAAKLQARIASARRGKIAVTPTSAKVRFPAVPRLGGAGAIFWRQATTAVRSSRLMIIILLAACPAVVPLMLAKGVEDPTPVVFSIVGMITLLGGQLFRFDFRADIDRMDTLKALPISPLAIVAGQLASPMFLMVAIQWLLFATLAVVRHDRTPIALACIAFAPLVSLLFTGLENLAFLLFPIRAAAAPGDLTVMARNMINMLGKFLALGLAGGLAAGSGFLVHLATDMIVPSLAVAWLVGAALTAGLVPLVAMAFAAFDVSEQSGPDA